MLPEPLVARFAELLAAAEAAGEPEPTAMTLATCDGAGRVAARTVLLKGFDARGFVFYSNTLSRKGRDIAANPRVALLVLWKRLADQVQVRIEGLAEPVSGEEADAYFAGRPRESQIGAWASLQSEPLPDRETLLRRCEEFARRFADRPVPRPPHWSGWRVVPELIEFWFGRPHRLHDRFEYRREDGWRERRLYP
ncbi:MAG: pyridoxamine 5'-phosphate oxidase [Xanthomonadales bacterium]|nr:pyridoxamine 5'-phosphate oxidase [Xanthomonadales bacterium]